MKAKSSVAKDKKPSSTAKADRFPDPVVVREDIPDKLPPITNHEMVEYLNALDTYRIAQADFERKRAALTFRLLTNHKIEGSDYEARIDQDGRLVVSEYCGVCNSHNVEPTRI